MSFDEAMAKVGTYLKNNDLSNSDNNDRFFYIILNDLRQEYAPTVEMTKTQYSFITSEYEQKNVVDAVANLTVDDILKENFHQSFWKPLTQNEVVQSWLHPETIKIVDEQLKEQARYK